jgi:LPS-assembly protein
MPVSARRSAAGLTVALLACLSAHAEAPTDWSFCGEAGRPPARPPLKVLASGLVDIVADEADVIMGGRSTARGDVILQYDTQQIRSDRIIYNPAGATVDAPDFAEVWDRGTYLRATRAHYELEPEVGTLDGLHYQFVERHGRGEARTGSLRVKEELLNLEDAEYTTCNPGSTDWLIRARSLRLDKQNDVGTAHHVRIRFKNVPVFYTPYLRFPLSDTRKTGFLWPSIGTSGKTGLDLRVPFYWNIAPQRDATFALRYMRTRGTQLQGEYRYLMRSGSGTAEAEYLPDDAVYGKDRWLYKLQHDQGLSRNWSTSIGLDRVSDDQYFNDLGTRLSVSAQQFLRSYGDLHYQTTTLSALGRLEAWQTIDPSIPDDQQPYSRLPQLMVFTSLPERSRTLAPQFYGEGVRFERGEGVTGNRLDLRPTLAYPIRTVGTFLVPKAALRLTGYNLQDTTPGEPDHPTRAIPTLSVDSGVFLERESAIGGRPHRQTLEPRLYYLYTPFKDQSDLPVFDTGVNEFTFTQMFRDNSFSGADRVQNANQLTFALTTRLLDDTTGAERVRLGLGQIRYFADRKVTLPGASPETTGASDIIAELAAEIARGWSFRGDYQWDPNTGLTDKGTALFRYQPDSHRVLNLSYRFLRDTLEQADLSGVWPVSAHWRFVGRWYYSIPDSRNLEILAGLEYQSCCWGLRAAFRRYLTDDGAGFNTAFSLQLVLKGLAAVGQTTNELLREQIPGYQNEF